MWIVYTLNGLYFAALLFLISLGLNIILGVMGILNLAHGSLYAIGAFIAAWVIIAIGMNVPSFLIYVTLLSGLFLAGIVGFLMEKS
jgi:branched-chain amino acid transport system permease protein